MVEVLLWVRKPKFLIATDILVHEDDCDLQRILWVDKEKNFIPYQLQTVTYGTRAAPFLAIRVLLQLVEDEGHKYPLAVDPIFKGRYVDDIFAGSDTFQGTEAISPCNISSIRSFILRCVQCTRYRGVRAQQLMGQLPSSMVTPSRAFLNSDIYAGPVTLKTWRVRGAKTFKGWIAVFVCLSKSAVHLDVVTDYTAESFITAHRQFISHRGICKSLSSDCGTIFIGADAALKELFQSGSNEINKLAHLLLNDGTSWHFNPPSAPHFGGKWEAAVKSTKFHLQRTLQDTILTYEELTTFLSQIEAVLNSRPSEPLSDDPDDLAVLTPGHFIIGGALNSVPEPSLEATPTSRLSHWQFIQQRFQYFWTKWSSEYL